MRIIVHRPDLDAESSTPAAPVVTPTALKLRNLKRALKRWLASGCRMAPSGVRKARLAVCFQCEHWHAAGNLGLGECRAPGCGCTRAKAWLATESCPLGKWKAHP